ncbi:hypothetical protein LTR56_010036 [Elasticomyces elasticus]|nr:hypothetical protein LTR56_010036 [Elasticomyces elasticus]KAK3665026.1 hypothetical protein LTR22_004080 [Elasticomyces elasticus]
MVAALMLHCLASVPAFMTGGNDGNKDPELASSAGSRDPPGVLVDPKNFDGVFGWSPFAAPALVESYLLAHAPPTSLSRPPQHLRRQDRPQHLPRQEDAFHLCHLSRSPHRRLDDQGLAISKAVQKELDKGWIYDGNKLAWSMTGRFALEDNKSGTWVGSSLRC